MQPDFFDETLNNKIYRMEKWILRLQRELMFLKEVHNMRATRTITPATPKKIQQLNLFGS